MIIHEHKVPKENADDILLVRKKYFDNGELVKKDDEILDLETSKTALIITSSTEGYVEYTCTPGEKVSVGDTVFNIHDSKDFLDQVNLKNPSELKKKSDSYKLSKAAKDYVEKNNIDLSGIKLSGLVSLETIKSISNDSVAQDSHGQVSTSTSYDRLSLSKINEIKALTPVNRSGLVSTIATKVRVSKNSKYFNDGVFREILFEASRLLKRFPLLNAFYADEKIHIYPDVNIGFAVDIDDGLKVLVVRNVDKLNFGELNKSVDDLISRYLDKSLQVSDLTGGGFTVTDLSSYGVTSFTPLVNANQSAMLGISAYDHVAESIEISISFDHRVTEGKYVANFLVELKDRLEVLVQHSEASYARCCMCMKSLSEDKDMKGIGFYEILKHDGLKDLICQVCAAG